MIKGAGYGTGFVTRATPVNKEGMSFEAGYAAIKEMEGRGVRTEDLLEFKQEPGKQHYRLLSEMASCFTGRTIIDIGTHKGSSAYALSITPELGQNKIFSFDICNNVSVEMQALLQSTTAGCLRQNLRRYCLASPKRASTSA